MELDFEITDWKAIVDSALTKTERGGLEWTEDEGQGPNARQFRAVAGDTTLVLFGRLRGYSYSLDLSRAGEETTSIFKVTNKAAAHDVLIHLLFKAAAQRVLEESLRQGALAKGRSLELIVASIGAIPGLTDAERGELELLDSADEWNTIIARLIEATRAEEIKWIPREDEENSYDVETGGLDYWLGRNSEYDSYEFWVMDNDGELGETRGWESSPLAELAHLIGISTQKSEEQFAAIAKAATLEDIMKDLQ